MITQQQNKDFKAEHTEFIQQCAEYKALLSTMDLPFTTDLNVIKQTIRKRVADTLLNTDPSLKARMDVIRTDAGRAKLRAETAATVDLDGYEDVEQIEASLQQLRAAYNTVGMLPDQYRLSFDQLAGHYKLDLAAVIDSRTMVWDDNKGKVLAYFESVAQQLHQVQKVLASIGRHVYPLDNMFNSLLQFYQPSVNGTLLKPDEEKIYTYAISELKEKGLLADFPNSVK